MTKLHELVYNNDETGLSELISSLKRVNMLAEYINAPGYSNPITGDKFLFKTPLMIAASMGYLNIIKLLVKEGAYVTSIPVHCTPLTQAIQYSHLECVEELLKDKNYNTISGITELEVALSMSLDNSEIQEILKQRITELKKVLVLKREQVTMDYEERVRIEAEEDRPTRLARLLLKF